MDCFSLVEGVSCFEEQSINNEIHRLRPSVVQEVSPRYALLDWIEPKVDLTEVE